MRSIFSASWYRVSALTPRLRSHAQIHRHRYRGETWYVLQDPSSDRFHRFSPAAYFVIGLMDGRRSVQELWDVACARLGDDAPTQDEVIQLLSQLHRADVLQSDIPPDVTEMEQRRGQRQRQHARRRRVAHFDPSPSVTYSYSTREICAIVSRRPETSGFHSLRITTM